MNAIVVNASPIILLAKSGLFHLLPALSTKVITTREVIAEVGAKDSDPITRSALASTTWLQIVETPPITPALLEWDLGAGETSVIATASSLGAEAVLDDLAARRCASTQEVRVVGTLGLIVRAHRRGLLSSAIEAIDSLRSNSLYISDALMTTIRAELEQ
jgi:predicted nucleic acid-binding protein